MAIATQTGNFSTEANRGKTGDAAANTADKIKETASAALDAVRQPASNIADKARQTASAIGQKAEQTTQAVGSGMKSLADTIRTQAPHEGFVGDAASSLAQGLETSGQYLQHAGIQGIAEDMTNMVRRNPIPALLAGVGLGYLLARATMRR